MNLANPIWLWSLTGLLIPIGIHLLSRKEGKTILVGSTRFLTETATSKFSSIKLNELVLLLVRCLLLLAITFFLCGLIWNSISPTEKTKWIVIENGLRTNPHIQTLLDSLSENGYVARALQPGFPPLPTETDTLRQPDYYKSVQELASMPRVEAIVIAKNNLASFKGKRITLPDNVRWIPFPVTESAQGIIPVNTKDTLHITLVYDEAFRYDQKILTAALKALRTSASKNIQLNIVPAKNFTISNTSNWLIWLSDNPAPDYPGKLITYRENTFEELLTPITANQWIITQRLDENVALTNHLTVRLAQILFANEPSPKKRDISITDAWAWSKTGNQHASVTEIQNQSANSILFLLIVLLFSTERILAFYRKQ